MQLPAGDQAILDGRLDFEIVAPTRKGCAVTRMFSRRVEDLAPLEQAVAAMRRGSGRSSGAVGLFHVIGTTPEVPDAAAAFAGAPPHETIMLTPAMIDETRRCLSTVTPEGRGRARPRGGRRPAPVDGRTAGFADAARRPALRHPALSLHRAPRLAGDRREPGAGGAPAAQAGSASHLGSVRTPIAAGLDRRLVHVMFRPHRMATMTEAADPSEAEIDAVIAEFGGDLRVALRAVLHDLAVLALNRALTVSRGYVRGNWPADPAPAPGRPRDSEPERQDGR